VAGAGDPGYSCNDEQRRIVEKAFAKEIELHGYRF
jgi:hypothetical protein